MSSESSQLHIFFLPMLAHGHMLPMLDMANLVASRGVMATIVTTPLNVPLVSRTTSTPTSTKINILTIKFPAAEVGLPEECEILDSDNSKDTMPLFIKAVGMLQEQLEQLLSAYNPDCLVADTFFTWATDSAAKFNIPRLVFHSTGFFCLCASTCVGLYEPHRKVSSDSEPFVIPSLPGEIKLTRMLLPDLPKTDAEAAYIAKIVKTVNETEERSYGVVVKSFYELEKDYADYYRKVFGRKAWHIGPLSLCNRNSIEEKLQRGKASSIAENYCLEWLDSKKPASVVYVCFGSLTKFSDSQLREIAWGLEVSGQQFIWVVKKHENNAGEKEEWLPDGFEKRIEGRGLIIRGWAPQVLILDHEAVGGFVTHCGWNSTLEGVSAGVSLVTWPVAYEQIYTEKLVTDVLQIGVSVGVKKCDGLLGGSIKREAIEKAVNMIMVAGEAEEMRSRAKTFAKMAKEAVKEGGSSYSDLSALIQELSVRRLHH
ncbi:Glycosyltransferase [Quillaja saponaria]|uniref:Glycosyltransferase n=1 Tax=Quillaja saponaria TaxID=32244 RepID=A0AAD7KUN4_QUISA|nr:Glycosyltransferase [Quillaja saponaria]WEU75097.1 UGT73B43 [Quillaja saponaria]